MDTLVIIIAWWLVLECIFDLGCRIFYPQYFVNRYTQGYTVINMVSGVISVIGVLLVLITFLRG